MPGSGDENYRLAFGSPAIDAGATTAVPVDYLVDLDCLPRFVDDPHTDDTGVPGDSLPVVDMGAYEFRDTCPADVNGDGAVGVYDLIEIITSWGLCNGCAADVNRDGIVNVGDLTFVIVNWGTSCSP